MSKQKGPSVGSNVGSTILDIENRHKGELPASPTPPDDDVEAAKAEAERLEAERVEKERVEAARAAAAKAEIPITEHPSYESEHPDLPPDIPYSDMEILLAQKREMDAKKKEMEERQAAELKEYEEKRQALVEPMKRELEQVEQRARELRDALRALNGVSGVSGVNGSVQKAGLAAAKQAYNPRSGTQGWRLHQASLKLAAEGKPITVGVVHTLVNQDGGNPLQKPRIQGHLNWMVSHGYATRIEKGTFALFDIPK